MIRAGQDEIREFRAIGEVAIVAAADDAAGKKLPRFAGTAYTGSVMRPTGWGLPLIVDLAGVRVPSQHRPVLRQHDHTRIVGHTDTVKVSATGIDIAGPMSGAGPDRDEVVKLAANGFKWQLSIGANPTRCEFLEAGEKATVNGREIMGPLTICRETELGEISFVPLGADGDTSATVTASKGKPMNTKLMLKASGKYSDEEVDKMTEDEAKAALKKCMKADEEPPKKDDDKKPADAATLVSLLANVPSDIQVQAAREGWSESVCRAVSLTHVRASRPTGFHIAAAGGNGSSSNGNGHGSHADVLVAALMMKAGNENFAIRSYGERTAQAARDTGLHRASFAEIVAAKLRADGIDPGTRRDVEHMIRADGPSTASVADLLSNSLNKTLEQSWLVAPGSWRAWCARKSANDFKPSKSLRAVIGGELELLAPGGEINHGDLSDWMITWQVYTFAKMFTISRTMLINDDLSAFSEVSTGLALMADRAASDLAYYNLLNNTGTFFSAGHANNQSGGSSALSSASLTVAIKQLRLQTHPNGSPLSIPPQTLVVSPALEQTAKEILHSSWQFRDQSTDRMPTGNPLEKSVELVVEPRLSLGARNPLIPGPTPTVSAGVPNQWFVFAAPGYLPAIMGFLKGAEAPTVQMAGPDFNFNVPGQSWRCLYDIGFSLGDYRAAQRSVGS